MFGSCSHSAPHRADTHLRSAPMTNLSSRTRAGSRACYGNRTTGAPYATPLHMKVLQVISSVSATRGGPSTAVRDLCRALRLHGVEVDVATTDDDGDHRRT